jgi:arginine decarboxylase
VRNAERRKEKNQQYYDASQFRHDTWNEFKQLVTKLDRLEQAQKPTQSVREPLEKILGDLTEIEKYFAYPGLLACEHISELYQQGQTGTLAHHVERLVRFLVGDAYRKREVSDIFHDDIDHHDNSFVEMKDTSTNSKSRNYFEVLVVDETGMEFAQEIRKRMLSMRRDQDEFIYDVVVVSSFEDAVIAVLLNHNLQSVVVRYSFPYGSQTKLPILRNYLSWIPDVESLNHEDAAPSWMLGAKIKDIRPELDLFLVTDDPVRNIAGHTGKAFRRVFYTQEDYRELHLSILRGIHDRYETPFFNALREYSNRPTGVFHALPISRGKSIIKSHWIQDMGEFYGENIFLAETSATTGGLDSLLQPHGAIKRAQEKAARAFGAQRSFFVTNGTSTANKIVVQALMGPKDIALVSRDCHKSHHYALVLSGSYAVYLDPYPLQTYSMYGAVPLRSIKQQLLALQRAGKLDRVRMVLLTNCTFDGVVYNPMRIMREVLAFKPDMIFVWDEAWFGFARFSPMYRQRTAMAAALTLRHTLGSEAYRKKYQVWQDQWRKLDPNDDATWLDNELMPDPDQSRIRVYATQSTHKTLTSLRQGSMIHVYDQDFGRQVHEAFEEAYMTHTSTSPNYQIIASLDVGRRQVELEGYEMVEQSISLAMVLRERIQEDPVLKRYFQVLKPRDLLPKEMRKSGLEEFYNPDTGYSAMDEAWRSDEFVLDPTRLTIHVGMTGKAGDELRTYLMDRHDIQVNKTSRNTVLFMLNIGTTRGTIAYLLEVLIQIARELDEENEGQSALEQQILQSRVDSLTKKLPPLPNFSRFHERFQERPVTTIEGDLREAFFLGRNDKVCDFLRLDGTVQSEMKRGRTVVSAGFVTPYPPGFPVLVPGQVVSYEILDYLKALDVKEIHGYNPEFGLRVFKDELLLVEQNSKISSNNRPATTGPSEPPTKPQSPKTTATTAI